jgi:hypothetical protein
MAITPLSGRRPLYHQPSGDVSIEVRQSEGAAPE